MKKICLAGGCFWGMQKFFDQFEGVLNTAVGYANGPDKAPSYEDVCNSVGHAEAVMIEYDEDVLSLENLLAYYFMVIDPVSVNRQGEDEGLQYRTGVFYLDEEDLGAIRVAFAHVQESISEPLAVLCEPLENFFPAEEYHQKYLEKNPGGYCHIPQHFFELEEKL